METIFDEKDMEDPDYQSASREHKREQGTLSMRQQDAKEQAIQRIEQIIHQQFGFEIHLKEREIDMIDERIRQAKSMLDRLRACVLAKYYGTSELKGDRTVGSKGEFCPKRSARYRVKQAGLPRTETQTVTTNSSPCKSEPKDSFEAKKPAAIETLISNGMVNYEFETKKPIETERSNFAVQNNSKTLLSTEKQDNLTVSLNNDVDLAKTSGEGLKFSSASSASAHQSQANEPKHSSNRLTCSVAKTHSREERLLSATRSHSNAKSMSVTCTGSRFYLKKRVIVGNTSKYISIDSREDNDKSTHKWMVYVRGPPEDSHIDRFIKKVWFFLHPSYRPNDIVEVNKPPFHLTRRGWGEFPVRVQLHFVDPRNKRVDIIHELKLDRTYTGLQTLGAETVVDLELDRRTFEDNGIPFTTSSTSIEESLATNLTAVSTNPSQSDNVRRGFVNSLPDKDQCEMLATVKCPASLDTLAQYPLLKKLKLESPMSVSSSAFSSVSSTPVNSQPASRCSSPEPALKNLDEVNMSSDEIHQLLRSAVKEHPLIRSERNVVKYPYCSSSIEQYLGWNIGKRRACEWQRAAAVRRCICRCMPSCKLSTKDVVVWCRRFGYTPCDEVAMGENASFCKLCGGRIAVSPKVDSEETETHQCEERAFSSLTTASRFFSEVDIKERSLPGIPQTRNESEDLEIDVVSFLPKKRTLKLQVSAAYSLSPTLEQEWIHKMCSDIGIKLKPVDVDGVYLHVVESLLLAATKRFAEDILRQSWACATDQTTSCGCRLVTPSHVHNAICSLPSCDFLRNAYLGEELSMDEK